MKIRIENLYLARGLYIRSLYIFDTLNFYGKRLAFFGREFDAEAFQIEEYGDDIFFDTLNGREFMVNTRDFYMGNRRARKRRENDATERVSEGVAIAWVKAVDLIRAQKVLLEDNLRL